MDEDLHHLDIEQLKADPKMWALLPEQVKPDIAVPEWPQFLSGCIQYRQSLDEQQPDARRISDESVQNNF
jgi:hypothetical protein